MGIEVEVGLRPRNQVTIPEEIVERLRAEPGDRIVFEWDEENPRRAQIRIVRRSYAGALAGVYGRTPEEVDAYLRGERESWET